MTTPDHSASGRLKLALTRSEAAAALGISPVTIDRLTRRKLLLPSRATRRPLFSLTELERFLRDTKAGDAATCPEATSPDSDANAPDSAGDQTNQPKGTAYELNRGRVCPNSKSRATAGRVPISVRPHFSKP